MCLTALATPAKLHGMQKHAQLLPIVPNYLTQQSLCSPLFPFPNSPHLCAALGIQLTHLQLGWPYIQHLVLRGGLHNPSYTVGSWSICPPLVYPTHMFRSCDCLCKLDQSCHSFSQNVHSTSANPGNPCRDCRDCRDCRHYSDLVVDL